MAALDDPSTGARPALPPDVACVAGDAGDRTTATRILRRYRIEAVAHLAGISSVSGHPGRILGRVLFPAMTGRRDRLVPFWLHGVGATALGLMLAVAAPDIVAVLLPGQATERPGPLDMFYRPAGELRVCGPRPGQPGARSARASSMLRRSYIRRSSCRQASSARRGMWSRALRGKCT